jgi:sugar phosphate isomerase/epimerase
MHLGIFAKTFPRSDLIATLDAIEAHGLTHVQFNMSCMGLPTLPDRLDEGSCVWIAQSLAERGLTMAAISGTFNMCDPVRSRIEHNLRRLEVLASACRWLDTRTITLCTGTRDREDMWRWHRENVFRRSWEELVQTMHEAVVIADRHEVTLAFEPEINNVVSSVMRARRLLDEIASPWLKVVIDLVNLIPRGEMSRLPVVLDEALDWLGPDIVLAHAKEPQLDDADRRALLELHKKSLDEMMEKAIRGRFEEDVDRLMELARYSPLPDVSEGPSTVFYHAYFARLKGIGYQGPLIIHGLDEAEVDQRIAQLRKILDPAPVED